MRRFFLLLIGSLIHISLFAQKPEIVSISGTHGANGSTLTINGNDFDSNPANLKVFFGGAPATIINSGNQIIEAEIPSGATFDNISVTNTMSRLSTYSAEKFYINYGGEHGLDVNKFGTQSNFNAESGLYDLCLCDFNKDGKLDVATVGEKANTVSFSINNSGPGSIALAKTSVTVNAETLHVTCGDLNGDGYPEIIATENDGDRVFVLKNNGNNTFTNQAIKLSGNKVKRVAVADLDLNGKPDLILTDQLKNIVSILSNQSSGSTIAFSSPHIVTLPDVLSSDALDIQDFNGDGLPEIITSPFFTSANNKILILINKSSPGNFNFDDIKSISANNTILNIKAGDLDGDGKPDFAVTRILNADIQIYRNTSNGETLTFAEPLSFPTATRPWGLDFGDLDGDGKLDISVASIEVKALSILNNESTSGSIAFAETLEIPTTYINKHVRIADVNTDGKPDLTFTSVDDGKTPVISSLISIIPNKACLVPKVTPGGPLTICTGLQFELTATPSNGTIFQWKKGGTAIGSASSANTLNVTDAGLYSVTATTSGCEKTSNDVNITTASAGAGLNGTDPDARNDGPVCTGEALQLTVNDVDATAYRWKGPNGFEQTTSNLTLSRENFQLEDAGLYIVEMLSNGCIAKIDSTLVEGVYVPAFTLNYSGSEEICQGLTKSISVSPLASSGFSFQWFEQTSGAIAGAINNTLEVSASGGYYLQIQANSGGCTPVTTDPIALTTVQAPEAVFSLPDLGCLNLPVNIDNQSTVDASAEAVFSWSTGGSPSLGENPEILFETTGPKTITLTITYNGVSGCTDESSVDLEIVEGEQPHISDSAQSLCVGDTLSLSVDGEFATILWNTNETTPSIEVISPGDYSVMTTDANGCQGEDAITIGSLPKPVINVTASKSVISLGQTVDLAADIEDPLDNNATFRWSPGETLDDSTKADPVAKPVATTVYTIVGTTEDGCSSSESIEIQVATIGAGIKAAAIVTPNNDTDNDTWTILGVENYPDCTITIYDSKGRKVFEKKGYLNDWAGEYNGHALPDGVYYFVFSCEGTTSTTGTVTLIR